MITIDDIQEMQEAEALVRKMQREWDLGQSQNQDVHALLDAKERWETLVQTNARDLLQLAKERLEKPKGIQATINDYVHKRQEQLRKES